MTVLTADVIVVGHGLAGLVATHELSASGRTVLLIDQEGPQDFGGQAYWSFGGLFMVGTPEQRLCGIRDSRELAWQDWLGSAQFTDDDHWPRQWAGAYVDFAAGEKRRWLRSLGWRAFPIPGWPERGGRGALGSGNSVPRFHITWGTGPGLVDVFATRVLDAESRGLVRRLFRHRVDELDLTDGTVTGVHGTVLGASAHPRGAPSTNTEVGYFSAQASAVVLATGGVGGNPTLVKELFTQSFGRYPDGMLCGNPAYVDGAMIAIARKAGAKVANENRLWFYPDGVANIDPLWPDHGIHVTAGPSALWLDGAGRRLPAPLFPNFDTVGAVRYVMDSGHSHSWLVMNAAIFRREFAMSGQELNPAITGRHAWAAITGLVRPRIGAANRQFLERGKDFVSAPTVGQLAAAMSVDAAALEREIKARDSQVHNRYSKDPQFAAIHNARRYWPDRFKVAKPGPILDPQAGPLIAVKLHITTRKTLGGLQTDLQGRVLGETGEPLSGLYAAGEVSGFGGGGIHGNRSLEGTFVGGCLFTGRTAGRNIARSVG
ncbi:FAD-binding dehydrogenase [Mycobacterium sp. MS1601]|uniref:FAD-binding dehydrogenase n=1 Tax=Mycobacterium sp. MS1601 TaxID=1936029 RepID=UPI00097904FF|nr:FAD-binding dehydrogenase [Mycobacterium sp. MS1601]AQA04714.1 FAD-binding dehydrogenase [Mycobacterium sp. MS1601]